MHALSHHAPAIVAALLDHGYVEIAGTERHRRFRLPGNGQVAMVGADGTVLVGDRPEHARPMRPAARAGLIARGRRLIGGQP